MELILKKREKERKNGPFSPSQYQAAGHRFDGSLEQTKANHAQFFANGKLKD